MKSKKSEGGMLFDTPGIRQGIASHIRRYGLAHEHRVIDQCLEEMAELQQELCKMKRGIGSPDRVMDEMSDLLLCLEFLGRCYAFGSDDVRAKVSALAVQLSNNLEYASSARSKLQLNTLCCPRCGSPYLKYGERNLWCDDCGFAI